LTARGLGLDPDAIVREIVDAEIPDDRRIAMMLAAESKLVVPYPIFRAVESWRARGHDIHDLLVVLMKDQTDVLRLGGYCSIAARDPEKRFEPQVRRALEILRD